MKYKLSKYNYHYIAENDFIVYNNSGAYAENNFSKSMNTVAVAIDPDTGKLIDIVEFNYFYQFAVGGNSITIVYPYTLHFFYK